MILLQSHSRFLLQTLLSRVHNLEKAVEVDYNWVEFDDVRYHVQVSMKNPHLFLLSVSLPIPSADTVFCGGLPSGAIEAIKAAYGILVQILDPPRDGFNLTLKLNLSKLPLDEGSLSFLFKHGRGDHTKRSNQEDEKHNVCEKKEEARAVDEEDPQTRVGNPFAVAQRRRKRQLFSDPSDNRHTVLVKLASIREVVLGAPLRGILKQLGSRVVASDVNKLVALVHRPKESFFLVPQAEKVTVVFPMRFKDSIDIALATSFLQEFVEARRTAGLNNAPPCSWSLSPPQELKGAPSDALSANAGFVTFVIFTRHVEGKRVDRVIWSLSTFHAYVSYHVKVCLLLI
uniref:Arp2/3 complex 34 kDa subunit n=1 Tax=Cucumis melo TaxID=3656 RepID=A0A9I9CQM0_CUCME